jgi:hypothetical protein
MEEGEGDHCGQYGLLVVDKFETSFKFCHGLTLLSIALCLGDITAWSWLFLSSARFKIKPKTNGHTNLTYQQNQLISSLGCKCTVT